jgi:hypothetical protein
MRGVAMFATIAAPALLRDLLAQLDRLPDLVINEEGEWGGPVLAAIAVVMPGVGSLVAAGPLSAGLGEAAGHVAGSLASVLSSAGVPQARAEQLQAAVEEGAVLLGVHTTPQGVSAVRDAVAAAAREVHVANWQE